MPYVGAGSQSVDRMTAPQPHGQWDGQTGTATTVEIQFMQIATAAAALFG